MFSRYFSPRRLAVLAATLLLTGAGHVVAAHAQADDAPVYGKDSPAVKQSEIQLLFDELRRERAETREAAARAKKGAKAHHGRGAKVDGVIDEDVAAGRLVTGASTDRKASEFGVNGTLVSPTNVKINDKTTDAAGAGQAEERAAVVGSVGIGAFNNGQGFNTGGDVQGLSYTLNGGATWIKTPAIGAAPAGSPPHFVGSPTRTWTSDPVVSVNEKLGDFWYCGLMANASGFNGVGAVRATFPGAVFTWDTPRIVVSYSNSTASADKEWFAADSSNGNLYASWTRFDASGDHIMYSRSINNGLTWSVETQLSDGADDGLVQGSRVEVGPNGEVYVCWSVLGAVDADYFKIRKSTNGGVSFAPEVVLTSEYSNFGTGAPGFNRQRGITFPSLGIDRSTGPNRGRQYVAFEDCVNWYDDPLGGGGSKSEVENNGFFANATVFTPGQRLRGSISSTSDLDYWAFSGTLGSTYIFWCDSLTGTLKYSMRIFCTDTTGGGTRLAGSGDLSNPGRNGFIVWTAPATATYYLRFAPGTAGGYRVQTGVDSPSGPPERARDWRDAFVTYSDDDVSWSTPTRANDDPAYYDNWLPEVQVGCDGYPYVMWYDFRDAVAKCGGLANIYATRSTNGGVTWAANQLISTAQTNFTTASSNIAPNMGDYNGMYGGKNIMMSWGDGRLGDVDVEGAKIVTGPGVVCPNDSTVLANTTYTPCFNVSNPNVVFSDTYTYTISLDRSWPGLPLIGSVTVPAGSSTCVSPAISIPDSAATGDVHLCIVLNCLNVGCPVRCCVTLHVLNPITATLATLVDASADDGLVKLLWEVSTSASVNVYRSQDGGTSWRRLASVAPDGNHRVSYTDQAVVRGSTYGYRLGVPQPGGEVMAGQTSVTVPLTTEFALHGVRPNPSVGSMSFAFSLTDNSPATIELVDLGGRRVFTRPVGSMGAGFHVVPLANANLPIGIYAVRLTQHGRTLSTKVTVIR